jgi:hypothetical protein
MNRFIAFTLLVSLAIAGCQKNAAPPSPSESPQSALDATPSLPIAIVTASAIPSPILTSTLAPTRTNIPDPSVKITYTPIMTFQEQCYFIDNQILPDKNMAGNLIFNNDSGTYSYDLGKMQLHRFAEIPYYHDQFTLSPDHKWLAYIEVIYAPDGHSSAKRLLQIINSEGRHLDLSYWVADWQWILNWIDNKSLSLEIPNYPDGTVTILNPFSGKTYEIFFTLPDLDKYSIHNLSSINSTLTGIVYSGKSGEEIIYNIFAKTNLFSYSYFPEAIWSTNGREIAVINNLGLILIDLDGNQTQVIVGVENFTWSPDSQLIAFWVGNEKNWQLALMDIHSQKVIYTCINDDSYYPDGSPVWSPDSQKFVVNRDVDLGSTPQNYYNFETQTVLVDINQRKAYRIPGQMKPIAWMTK